MTQLQWDEAAREQAKAERLEVILNALADPGVRQRGAILAGLACQCRGQPARIDFDHPEKVRGYLERLRTLGLTAAVQRLGDPTTYRLTVRGAVLVEELLRAVDLDAGRAAA